MAYIPVERKGQMNWMVWLFVVVLMIVLAWLLVPVLAENREPTPISGPAPAAVRDGVRAFA